MPAKTGLEMGDAGQAQCRERHGEQYGNDNANSLH
jgi:hypothetical protein